MIAGSTGVTKEADSGLGPSQPAGGPETLEAERADHPLSSEYFSQKLQLLFSLLSFFTVFAIVALFS